MEVQVKMDVKEMEAKEALDFINREPEDFLKTICARNAMEVEIGGLKHKISKDNIRGGVVIFCKSCLVHFLWDKSQKKWILSSCK